MGMQIPERLAHWVNLSELREWGFMMRPTEVPHQSTEAKPLKQSLPSGCTSTSALDKLGRSTLVKPRKTPSGVRTNSAEAR